MAVMSDRFLDAMAEAMGPEMGHGLHKQSEGPSRAASYGYPPDLVEPPDGGYSFIEWDEIDYTVKTKMFRSFLGWREDSWQYVTDETHEKMRAAVLALQGTHELPFAKTLFKEPGRAEIQKHRWDGYLKASLPEIAAIEALFEKNHGNAGVMVELPEAIPRYTCGLLQGSSFVPVKPGNMVDAIIGSEPWLIREERNREGRVIQTFGAKVVKLR